MSTQIEQTKLKLKQAIENVEYQIVAKQSEIESKQYEIDHFEYECSESEFDEYLEQDNGKFIRCSQGILEQVED